MTNDDRNKDDARFDVDAAADPVIDPLIDDVAREMTSAFADTGLARRVSARIDAERETRTWPRAWLLAPAAAACVLALAMFVARQHPEPAPAQTVRTNPEAVREGAAGPQTLAAPAVTAVTSLKGAAPGTAPRIVPAALGTRPAAARPASPDLGPLAPIVLEPVNVSPLVVVMPIEISTIAIDRIEIPAMP
jgi:hypothetical protein